MKYSRTIAAGALSVGLMAPIAGAEAMPALGDDARSAQATSSSHEQTAAASALRRQITAKVVNITRTKLQMRAHVRNYRNKFTGLERRRGRTGGWFIVQRKRTTDYGRVFYNLSAPPRGRFYYRVFTPPRGPYVKSYGPTFYTYRY